MFHKNHNLTLLLFISLLLNACGTSEKNSKIEQGRVLFEQRDIGFVKAPGCILCHSLKKGFKAAGPSLYGISKRAANIKTGTTAKKYIHESIINPSIYVVDGYRHDLMYPHYENDLEPDELENLVTFLLTQ